MASELKEVLGGGIADAKSKDAKDDDDNMKAMMAGVLESLKIMSTRVTDLVGAVETGGGPVERIERPMSPGLQEQTRERARNALWDVRNVSGKFKTAQTNAEKAIERSDEVLKSVDGFKNLFATKSFAAIEAFLEELQKDAEEASRFAEEAGGGARAAAQALVGATSTANEVVRYSASDPQLRTTVAELNGALRETKQAEEACMGKLMAAQNGAVDATRAVDRARERCAKEQEKVAQAAERQREQDARNREQDRREMMEDRMVRVLELLEENRSGGTPTTQPNPGTSALASGTLAGLQEVTQQLQGMQQRMGIEQPVP